MIKTTLDILKKYMKSAPVDVEAMANAIGVDVVRDILGSRVSAKIQRDNSGKYTIVINAHDSKPRQRFSIAHELAHYLYHRDLIGDGVSDSPAYRAPDESIYESTPLERKHEVQANQFAANVLMPVHLIRELKARGISSDAQMAKELGVSIPAMRIRNGKSAYA